MTAMVTGAEARGGAGAETKGGSLRGTSKAAERGRAPGVTNRAERSRQERQD